MTLDERRLAVGILFSLAIGLRLLAARQARTWEHGDGFAREGFGFGVVLRLLVVIFGIGGSIAWVARPELLPWPVALPAWSAWVGVALAELGVLLLIWVHMALGVHFSGTLHLREDHRLVDGGPYAYVRHPMYTSFLALFSGLALLIGDGLVAAAYAVAMGWVLGIRLKDEEAMMAQRFGPEWDRFRSTRGRVFPRWR